MQYQFQLTDVEFRLIREFIHERFGIFLKDEKRSFIQMRLYPRVMNLGLSSFNDYINHFKYGPDRDREVSRMISLLTNNETYFFRELPQLHAFRDFLLRDLRATKVSKDDKNIRILSAGCSTGEEVYTLAMLMYETGSFFWGWDLRITGMDISEKALAIARRGIYYSRSFRMTAPMYLPKFFSTNCESHSAKDSIRRVTDFTTGNITDPSAFANKQGFDVIFCRNVLIYFSEEKVKAAVENFYNALNPGGYLLLGHSETLTGIYDEFETKRFPETIVYRKKVHNQEQDGKENISIGG